jgi:hypothetical protein
MVLDLSYVGRSVFGIYRWLGICVLGVGSGF